MTFLSGLGAEEPTVYVKDVKVSAYSLVLSIDKLFYLWRSRTLKVEA